MEQTNSDKKALETENKEFLWNRIRLICVVTAIILLLTLFIYVAHNIELLKADPCKLCEDATGAFCTIIK